MHKFLIINCYKYDRKLIVNWSLPWLLIFDKVLFGTIFLSYLERPPAFLRCLKKILKSVSPMYLQRIPIKNKNKKFGDTYLAYPIRIPVSQSVRHTYFYLLGVSVLPRILLIDACIAWHFAVIVFFFIVIPYRWTRFYVNLKMNNDICTNKWYQMQRVI